MKTKNYNQPRQPLRNANYAPTLRVASWQPRTPQRNQLTQIARPPVKPHGWRKLKLISLTVVLLLGFVGFTKLAHGHAESANQVIKSGIAGYCLDDHRNRTARDTPIDSWGCNGTEAQSWILTASTVKHGANDCLSVLNNGHMQNDKIVLDSCNGESGQTWVGAIGGLENPSSDLCLAIPNGKPKAQLILHDCNELTQPDETWIPVSANSSNSTATVPAVSCATGSEGQKVACYAAEQWVAWQSGSPSHPALLEKYSDGNAYEEWCADFISYVYKQAGYPFSAGEREGWDEYDANNLQNMGFTIHAATDYVPQAGDVAFFDYPGGHVEIVAVGGSKPIFIYGDSGAKDPATGNGQMAENGILDDGANGQVTYYLSPH